MVYAYILCNFQCTISAYAENRITKDKLVNSDLFHTVNNSVKSV